MNLIFKKGPSFPISQGILLTQIFFEDGLAHRSQTRSVNIRIQFFIDQVDIYLGAMNMTFVAQQFSDLVVEIVLDSMANNCSFRAGKELFHLVEFDVLLFEVKSIKNKDTLWCGYLNSR